mgnify:CR=1 FL=1
MTEATPLSREQMAWRAAQDLAPGMYVNLGLGMPVLVASYVEPGSGVMFHSENGVVGVGAALNEDEGDPDLVDAGSQMISLVPGAAIMDSAASFALIRGGHLDVTLLGGFEVSASGDLANWDAEVPGKGQLVGGAMDLAVGAKSVHVLMNHTTRDGKPRLVDQCALPLTGAGVVTRVYTDLSVVDVDGSGFMVREIVEGLTKDALQALSGAPLRFADNLAIIQVPQG